MTHRIHTRAPRGIVPDTLESMTDRDQLEAVEHDAANYPAGKASALAKPQNEAEVSAILQRFAKILPVGAQSSVTGGASPNGEVVLSLARQDRILESGLVLVSGAVLDLERGQCIAHPAGYFEIDEGTGSIDFTFPHTNAPGAEMFSWLLR